MAIARVVWVSMEIDPKLIAPAVKQIISETWIKN